MKTGKAYRLIWRATTLGAVLAIANGPATAKRAAAQPATVLTEQTRGFVSARVGVPIEIQLRAQPGTGFTWVPTRPVAGLTDLKPIRASKQMPGSAQMQRFRFVAPARGTYRLIFSYDQPWRGGSKGARTKGFIVVAR